MITAGHAETVAASAVLPKADAKALGASAKIRVEKTAK
jgi:hypothetical protein